MFKKLLFSTFLIILISSEISQDVSFLKNFKSSDRLVYITDDYPEKTIDASSSLHRNILFANYHNSINTSLNVNCLNKETSIEIRRLCFSKNVNSEKACYSIDEIPEDITDEFQLDIKNKTNGFIFKIQKNNINRQNELYGVFSCNIGSNEKTMIESLYVQISDPGSKLGKFLPAGHGETEIVNPYSKRDLPLTFECLSDIKDDPVQNLLVLPYKFAYCSITPNVTTVYSCAGSRKAFSPDLGYVNKVGDLVVYNRTLFNDSSIAIVCISRKTFLPIKGYVSSLIHDKKYKSGITINKATLEQEEYIAQSSRSEYFNVLVGEKDFELHASYKEPVGGSTFKWFKEGKEIIDCEDCSQYHYRFKKEITFSDTGYYKLRLTSVEDPEKSLQFTYDINPFGAPFFKESPDMRIGYFLKGKPIQVLFELENEADFKVDVSPSTVKKAMHNSRSDMLNLFLYANQSSVENIKINVLASNEYGKSRIERIIKPIENIVPKESLKKYDCFADCMNRTRELVFDVDEEKITKLKEMGIFYEQDWTINQKINLEDLPEDDEIFEYFKYDKEEPGKLMVKPYKDEGLIDNALEKMNFKRKKSIEEVLAERFNNPNLDKVEIEARVKYYLPSKDKDGKSINFYMASPPLNIEPEIKIINNKEYKLLYDSVYSKHREDNSPLKATLQFDKPITQASLGWIAAVVFGIIALLVVLVVCCFYCKKNKKSKSYEPRKSEEKRGLSPDSNFNSNRILQPLIPSETDKVYMTSDVSPKNNDDIEEGDLK